ncbi:MAG: hypothetical protein V3T70_08120 [Phycisphaerae bacterium]
MHESRHEPQPTDEPDLIGYHMGLLEADEAARIAAALQGSGELRARYESVAAELAPLESMTVSAPSPDLADRIYDRVVAAPRLVLAAAPRDRSLPDGHEAPQTGGLPVSFRELVGLAAAVALFVALSAPAFQRSRAASRQAACLANVQKIGMGVEQYAHANAGAFPYVPRAPGPWLASATNPQASVVSNTRGLFLLLKQNHVSGAGIFICPSRPNDMPMDASAIYESDDFTRLENVSYDPPLLDEPLRTDRGMPDFPVMADRNSQFENRRFQERANLNSDNHGPARGPNLLRLEGGATWTDRTDVGPDRDNIMRLADLTDYTGWERPQYKTDVFLVP